MEQDYKYVFGPVPSRRLGYSLGLDLIPFKTCTYDCIYCQLGGTIKKTVERKNWIPAGRVVDELRRKLKENVHIDYITLSGSGEPTLHDGIGSLIRKIKSFTAIPVAVLTNGSLLMNSAVQMDLAAADLVIPSLDAGTEQTFQKINRPDGSISFQEMVHGLVEFRQQFSHSLWLEVFLLKDINAVPEEVKRIGRIAELVRPEKIQLNTVKRPPSETAAQAVSSGTLSELAGYIPGPVEIIAEFHPPGMDDFFKAETKEIKSLLRRRPCSLDDIASALHFHQNEVLKYLGGLLDSGEVDIRNQSGTQYYVMNKKGQT